jgi:yeast amino acid transporter
MGVMIFNVVYALGELAVMYPVAGSFYTYSVRFVCGFDTYAGSFC